uniref:FXYD domain-containing ion transport regulator n=1 Tax=Cyprinodon variegatus TaxID=28743 RepID=A0A3Q2D8D8_CYPVA
MFLDCGRKPEYPERIHTCSGRTCKTSMQKDPRPGIEPETFLLQDYETLRTGGLAFAGVIVFLSIILLCGNKIRRCGKPKVSLPLSKFYMDLWGHLVVIIGIIYIYLKAKFLAGPNVIALSTKLRFLI